jgi:hypothetical protein
MTPGNSIGKQDLLGQVYSHHACVSFETSPLVDLLVHKEAELIFP